MKELVTFIHNDLLKDFMRESMCLIDLNNKKKKSYLPTGFT